MHDNICIFYDCCRLEWSMNILRQKKCFVFCVNLFFLVFFLGRQSQPQRCIPHRESYRLLNLKEMVKPIFCHYFEFVLLQSSDPFGINLFTIAKIIPLDVRTKQLLIVRLIAYISMVFSIYSIQLCDLNFLFRFVGSCC